MPGSEYAYDRAPPDGASYPDVHGHIKLKIIGTSFGLAFAAYNGSDSGSQNYAYETRANLRADDADLLVDSPFDYTKDYTAGGLRAASTQPFTK